MQEGRYPELRLLHANPNHNILLSKLPKASAIAVIAYMKAEGLSKGLPDTHLPVARKGFHGLYIELKVDHNKPTPEQAAWLDALTQQGYLAVACWGWSDARDVIEEYLQAA
jgi:hypothetical protein